MHVDTMCAPLWDSVRGDFAGTITSSDICDIMRIFYAPGTAASALSELTIGAWREYAGSIEGMSRGLSSPLQYNPEEVSKVWRKLQGQAENESSSVLNATPIESQVSISMSGSGDDVEMSSASVSVQQSAHQSIQRSESGRHVIVPSKGLLANKVHSHMISIHPEDDLLAVSMKLREFHIHHMPVLDIESNTVIAVLSHKSLLTHIMTKFTDTRRLFDTPLEVLNIGSYGDVVVVPETASVISVLHVLAERKISSVPIVHPETGVVTGIFARDDVAFLANDPTLMVLDAPVGDVRRAQAAMTGVTTPLITCSKHDTLHHALELFAAAGGKAERLIAIDENSRVNGVVSLTDIFSYFSSV